MPLYLGVKQCDDVSIRSDVTSTGNVQTTGRTDRQTDGRTDGNGKAISSSACMGMLPHDENG